MPFSTIPLDLYQWSWCLTIGFSNLIWGQIIIAFCARRQLGWLESLTRMSSNMSKISSETGGGPTSQSINMSASMNKLELSTLV